MPVYIWHSSNANDIAQVLGFLEEKVVRFSGKTRLVMEERISFLVSKAIEAAKKERLS